MKVVGLTGGIGSGKTTVAKMFAELGVPLYIADDEAKKLMHLDPLVREKIVEIFGPGAYKDGKLDRKMIASKVFKDDNLLTQMNAIVHPAVAKHFETWKEEQKGPYIIYEAAILFEHGGHTKCDYTILITAPVEVRMQRIQKRDQSTLEEIKERMNKQWTDEKKIKLADFIIENIDISQTQKAVHQIHQTFLKSA